ncbi:MAG: carbohydrate porin, partial [Betaproteobacteria bacterium]
MNDLPQGIALQIGSTLDALSNTRGGRARGYAPSLLTEFRAGFDLERLALLPGVSAELHLINHALDRINATRVGAITGVTNIEAVHSGTKLYRLWVERESRDSGLALRVGLFPLEDEFFTLESAGSFIHPTNGPQGDYAATLGAAIYNHAGFGARLRATSDDRSRYLMAALLDRPLEDTNFVRVTGLSFPRAPGLHLMIEAGFTPLEASDLRDVRERFYKTALGAWTYSRRDEHLSARDAWGQADRSRSFGWYVLHEQTLLTASDGSGKVTVFARLSGS